MIKTIKIKRGFDINLAGEAAKNIGETDPPETYALKPTDFVGIKRPKLMVEEGDTVKAGTPLLYCKQLEKVKYTSPVSGEVVEIVRGKKRKLLEIRILADKEIEYEQFRHFSVSDIKSLSRTEAADILSKSGVWPNIIQRPYGIVADPENEPRDIFISAFDSHPLAPDYDFMLRGQENYVQAGIDILKKFTSGLVHVTIDADAEVSKIFSHLKSINLHKISGPHPSGNVGIQIHQIDPVKKEDIVWTTTPYGLAQIGKLFLEGRYDASKIIAVAGSEIKEPKYFRVHSGTNVEKLVKNNLSSENVRVISGNVLTGEKINLDGYLGYYDHLITVIPEGNKPAFMGWIKPTAEWLSFHRSIGLLSFLNSPSKKYRLTTNTRGDKRAFVQTGIFEKVLPMDIYPVFLFKAILAEDYDEMEALGIYELIEEDVALCEFVDVSKHNVQQILRQGLVLLENS